MPDTDLVARYRAYLTAIRDLVYDPRPVVAGGDQVAAQRGWRAIHCQTWVPR